MPEKTCKHSRSARIHRRTVSLTKASLQALPEKNELLSLQEAIRQLHGPLEAALSKGYSYRELATVLQQRGISISTPTLKNYLTSARQQDSRITASSKLRNKNSKNSPEKPSSAVEVFIPSKTEISSYTVGCDFWSAYQESLREREEVYRRLAES
jgi:hypothetical protein